MTPVEMARVEHEQAARRVRRLEEQRRITRGARLDTEYYGAIDRAERARKQLEQLESALRDHAHARRELLKLDRERSEFQRLGRPWPYKLMRQYQAVADRHLAALRRYEQLAGKPPPGEEDGTDEHPSSATHHAGTVGAPAHDTKPQPQPQPNRN